MPKGIPTSGINKGWFKKDFVPWNNGLKGFMAGENNSAWKGDKVGYRGLHRWVQKQLGKANKCSNDSHHQSTRFGWANISGKYKRDLNDWHELCHKCNRSDGIKIPERLYERRMYT